MRITLIILLTFLSIGLWAQSMEYAVCDRIIPAEQAAKLKFSPLPHQHADFGYFNHYVWIRFSLNNRSSAKYYLYFDQFYVEELLLYIKQDSGFQLAGSAGSLYPPNREYFSPLAQRGHVIPFDARTTSTECYLFFKSIYSPIRGDIELLNSRKQLESYKGDMLWLLIFGAMLFAALVALVFFGMNHKWIFLIYTFFVLSNLLNLAAIRGFLASYEHKFEFFPYDSRAMFNAILLLATLIYVIGVVPKKYSPRILRWSMIIVIIAASAITLLTLLLPGSPAAYHFLVYAFKPLVFFSFIIPLLYFYLAYKKGHKLSAWFVAGYAVLMCSGILHMLQSLGLMTFGQFNGIWELGIVLELLVFTLAFAIDYKQALEERLRLARIINKERIDFLQKFYQAQEEERRSISQYIHDGILQDLNVVKLHLNQSETPETIQKLDDSMHELRQLSHKLMPKDLQMAGLDKAMEELIRRSLETTNITWSFDAYNLNTSLSEEIRLNLYRILQELINNAIKHSKCSGLKVMLYETADHILLIVEDNGTGYKELHAEGIGMQSIRIRLETLKGEIKTESTSGKGTLHTIKIPH